MAVEGVTELLGRLAPVAFEAFHVHGRRSGEAQAAIAEHPDHGQLLKALDEDAIGGLFPDGKHGFASLSTGSGVQLERDSLPWILLATPAAHLTLTREQVTFGEYLSELRKSVSRLRRLVAGETVHFPVLMGFAGVEVSPGLAVELPWGQLRRPSGAIATLGDWTQVDFVLVASTAVRLAITEAGADPTPAADFFDTNADKRMRELEDKTVLAVLLGLTAGKPAAVRMWQLVLGPFHSRGYGMSGGGPRPLYGSQAHVGPDEVPALVKTASMVEKRHEPKLSPAVRRVVSSVTARFDVTDGLVDAVIALEALFAGTDKSELRFRISAAVAWLLEPQDAAAREAVFKETRTLYDQRSTVVHGQGVPANAKQLRDRAFSLSVECLRQLYAEFPTLLRDDQRSAKIILHTGS